MPQKIHFTAVATVLTVAIILMLNSKLNSLQARAKLLSEALQRQENSRNSLNNLEKELSFLNPEILACEEIFGRHQNKREFEHIWSELKKYDLILETVKSEVRAKNIKKPCHEGYSYKYTEEGQIMAKLAR